MGERGSREEGERRGQGVSGNGEETRESKGETGE